MRSARERFVRTIALTYLLCLAVKVNTAMISGSPLPHRPHKCTVLISTRVSCNDSSPSNLSNFVRLTGQHTFHKPQVGHGSFIKQYQPARVSGKHKPPVGRTDPNFLSPKESLFYFTFTASDVLTIVTLLFVSCAVLTTFLFF